MSSVGNPSTGIDPSFCNTRVLIFGYVSHRGNKLRAQLLLATSPVLSKCHEVKQTVNPTLFIM